MSSISVSSHFNSNLGIVSKLLGNSLEKFITRKLSKLRNDFQKIYEAETEHLEQLNQYKEFRTEHGNELEKELRSYQEITEIVAMLNTLLKDAKEDLTQDDELYIDFVLLLNQISDLKELMEKVIQKKEQIHNKILVKSTEMLSSEILDNIWKDEAELWDNFYLESKTTK